MSRINDEKNEGVENKGKTGRGNFEKYKEF